LKIALLGDIGMLGSKSIEVFSAGGHSLLTPSLSEVDLTRPLTIEAFFKSQTFDVLINCAAFTKVDACEEPAKFTEALSVNGTAVGWLAKFCKKNSRVLVHYSTDYVFNGRQEQLYDETQAPDPVNAYGRTKWQGEKLILAENPFYYIVRTSWLYGPKGVNFVKTIAGLLKTRPRLEVVDDQVGGPSYTGDVARFTMELLEKKAEPGIYHFANSGYTSWFGFAKEIKGIIGSESCKLVPVSSEGVFRLAQRPANSCFNLDKAKKFLGRPPRPWPEALKDYLTKEYPHEAA
jgi:dTDP-4-dehydrorhamnose reductase